MRPKLTFANVMSVIAVFIALGGTSYAISKLPKNSVGSKQLKKNAVTTAKVKKEAITAAKVKNRTLTGANVASGSLTGTQINASTLGTVPTAQTANSIAAPEGYHEVTDFLNGWSNVKASPGDFPETVAFYKDHEGVVHLRGLAVSGAGETFIFKLPPGYRPASGKFIHVPVGCGGPGCPANVNTILILGSNSKNPADEGGVLAPGGATAVDLDGVTFRAES